MSKESKTKKREDMIALQVGQCQSILLSDVDGERTHRASSKLRKEAAERNLSILARPSKCFHKDLLPCPRSMSDQVPNLNEERTHLYALKSCFYHLQSKCSRRRATGLKFSSSGPRTLSSCESDSPKASLAQAGPSMPTSSSNGLYSSARFPF